MLKNILRPSLLTGIIRRTVSTSPALCVKKITVEKTGNTTVIQGHIVPSPREGTLLEIEDLDKKEACPVCRLSSLGIEIKHTDVLVLKQFVRKDNTMLPRRITGLCEKQQKRVGYMVAMAREAGLLNDRPHYYMDRVFKKQLVKLGVKYNRYFDESTIEETDPTPDFKGYGYKSDVDMLFKDPGGIKKSK